MPAGDTSLDHILNHLAVGQTPTASMWQQLATEALELPQWLEVFGLTSTQVEEVIQARSPSQESNRAAVGLAHLFQTTFLDIHSLLSIHPSPKKPSQEAPEISQAKILSSLYNLWLPLALQLATCRQQMNRPFIQGILGGQGTGKTTLAAVLSLILAQLGYRTLSLSLDDLYKTYSERQRLQQTDPRLIWRGPPGTHDIELGRELLDQLRSSHHNELICVPRFDKSAWGGAGDRTTSKQVKGIDLVLFEGWFVGVRPINPARFDSPTPAPIATADDRAFARDMNQQLQHYLPLWERLDRLMVLYPVDYRLSQQWRRQAEHQMIATGKSGMTDLQVDRFVEYFWKSLHPELFITPLTRNPRYVDLVVEINPDHSIGAIYRPNEVENI